jgi:acyl-coenzyme A synthetase/AMP-(fatty) acid ligase
VTRSDKAFEELLNSNVDVVIASPAALAAVLQTRPAGSSARVNGPVIVAGGRLTVRLRDLLLADFCSEVLVAYGSSETGGVTLADSRLLDEHPGSVGSVFPDVRVQIVDDGGRPVSAGVPGRMRIRTSSSVRSYENDPVATMRHFSEGWFYPGDIAQISSEGQLILLGRDAETLNIGGVKLPAIEIDDAARSVAGVEDACAVVLPDRNGGVRLGIAAIGQPDAVRHLPPRLRSTLPDLPPFSVVPVDTIPRSSMGKVNREAFAHEIVERLQNPGAAGATSNLSTFEER